MIILQLCLPLVAQRRWYSRLKHIKEKMTSATINQSTLQATDEARHALACRTPIRDTSSGCSGQPGKNRNDITWGSGHGPERPASCVLWNINQALHSDTALLLHTKQQSTSVALQMKCRKNSPLTASKRGWVHRVQSWHICFGATDLKTHMDTEKHKKAVQGESTSAKWTEFFVRPRKNRWCCKCSGGCVGIPYYETPQQLQIHGLH